MYFNSLKQILILALLLIFLINIVSKKDDDFPRDTISAALRKSKGGKVDVKKDSESLKRSNVKSVGKFKDERVKDDLEEEDEDETDDDDDEEDEDETDDEEDEDETDDDEEDEDETDDEEDEDETDDEEDDDEFDEDDEDADEEEDEDEESGVEDEDDADEEDDDDDAGVEDDADEEDDEDEDDEDDDEDEDETDEEEAGVEDEDEDDEDEDEDEEAGAEDEDDEDEDDEDEDEEATSNVKKPSSSTSPNGIVYSWHVLDSRSDYRWGLATVGAGNEFYASVLSVHRAHPNIPIYLFTNAKDKDIDARAKKLIKVIKVGHKKNKKNTLFKIY